VRRSAQRWKNVPKYWCPTEIPVVAKQNFYAIGEPRLPHTFGCERVLFARDRGRGHTASVRARSMESKATPSRADLEHVVLGAQSELAAEAVVLGDRCITHGCTGRFEHARGVRHRFVEKCREEVVPEVVVRSNVAGAPAAGVPVARVQCCAQRLDQSRGARFQPVEDVPVAHEDANEGGEVRRGPLPQGIRLGRSYVATERDSSPERRVVHGDLRCYPVAGAVRGRLVAGMHGEPAPGESIKCGAEGALSEGVEHAHAGCFAGCVWKGVRFSHSLNAWA